MGVGDLRENLKLFQILLCSILITGTPYGSIAADSPPLPPKIKGIISAQDPPVPITPPGNDGLLSGMTPGNYKIPSGWSMVRATDFEGTEPSGESWVMWDASVQTDR